MSKTTLENRNFFSAEDLDKIITDLFGKSSNCGDVMNFIKENPELLLKTVRKNKWGIEEGSTAFHLLAMKSFNITLSNAYKYKMGILRDIFTDVQKVIQCLYDNIDNDEFLSTIRNMNIMGKIAGGKTALDIAESEPPNIYLVEFIKKIEPTATFVEEPTATFVEEPITVVDGLKMSTRKTTKKRRYRTNILTFRIDKKIIMNITEDDNKLIIKTVSPYESSSKGYKIIRTMRTRKTRSKLTRN